MSKFPQSPLPSPAVPLEQLGELLRRLPERYRWVLYVGQALAAVAVLAYLVWTRQLGVEALIAGVVALVSSTSAANVGDRDVILGDEVDEH